LTETISHEDTEYCVSLSDGTQKS